jgi:hypothetical protein
MICNRLLGGRKVKKEGNTLLQPFVKVYFIDYDNMVSDYQEQFEQLRVQSKNDLDKLQERLKVPYKIVGCCLMEK